jgi:3-hydroxymyristoyl/3-hydroxydecanoyl-(acyl carrier protein) dehydratase
MSEQIQGWSDMRLEISRGHPAYEGHFPGNPILPGVVLLSEALAAIEAATGRAPHQWTVSHCKFPNPVAPGTELTLAHKATASGGVLFEIRAAQGVVASGTLMPRPRA